MLDRDEVTATTVRTVLMVIESVIETPQKLSPEAGKFCLAPVFQWWMNRLNPLPVAAGRTMLWAPIRKNFSLPSRKKLVDRSR